MNHFFRTASKCITGYIVALFLFAPLGDAQAAGFSVLYTFCSCGGGSDPGASLIMDKTGNLYGTTYWGGNTGSCPGNSGLPSGCGVVFKYAQGGTESALYKFCSQSNCGDGAGPNANVIEDASGNLYGTTNSGGGANCSDVSYFPGCGVVFELSPSGSGWAETVIHAFQGGNDGAGPSGGGLIARGGNFYGTTYYGGGTGCGGVGCGTVFELLPQQGGGWAEKVLYAFQGGSDGGSPYGSLLVKNGKLYGTTVQGGGTGCAGSGYVGCGTVFELSRNRGGWTETVIYSFQGGTDGANPFDGNLLADKAGNFYGTTQFGGGTDCTSGNHVGCGTVFAISPQLGGGWTEQVLYAFQGGNDADLPQAGLVSDKAGNLYGTTMAGGNSNIGCGGQVGCGTVFELLLTQQGGDWTESVLHSFCSQNGCTDGVQPVAGLIRKGADFYGTAQEGGGGFGTVFELTN